MTRLVQLRCTFFPSAQQVLLCSCCVVDTLIGIRDPTVGKTGSHYLHSGLCSVRKTDIDQTIAQTNTTLNCDKCNEEASPHFVGS